jgi:hypothetical protein
MSIGQLVLWQDVPAMQLTSHEQASRQLMLPQESPPLHVTVHLELAWQLMLSHAAPPVQLIVQVQPLGHVTEPQLSVLVHSAVHVFLISSHVLQSLGQFGMTQ